jgi:hypothetical protein
MPGNASRYFEAELEYNGLTIAFYSMGDFNKAAYWHNYKPRVKYPDADVYIAPINKGVGGNKTFDPYKFVNENYPDRFFIEKETHKDENEAKADDERVANEIVSRVLELL